MDGSRETVTTRWLIADQLGPHFLDEDVDHVLLIESRHAFVRRRMHRAKAHLILSAMRHRAAELGDQATLITAESMADVLPAWADRLDMVAPTSWGMRTLARRHNVSMLPARGFVTSETVFDEWAERRAGKRLRMEDFYREVRQRTGILMDGNEPIGGRWNFDHDNRLPPPRGARTLDLPPVWQPQEDDIDAQVRRDLDRWEAEGAEFIGQDGPRRFAATRGEALAALEDFVEHRLATFGPYEDAALTDDWVMAHSLISAPMNLGLLDPLEVVQRVLDAGSAQKVPLSSVEGFVRQVIGWRDYVWHLYWYLGPDYIDQSNALDAHAELPDWFANLDSASEVSARCLSVGLGDVRAYGWTHHIVRLMILGNWALQHGFDPVASTRWFTDSFVDGHEWVMAANVVGMALHADGGRMATKPYAAGGAYIKRMTDFCGGCAYRPDVRVGDRACPVTAGYWAFLDRHRERFARHPRMAQPVRGLDRLVDREQLVEAEKRRGSGAP